MCVFVAFRFEQHFCEIMAAQSSDWVWHSIILLDVGQRSKKKKSKCHTHPLDVNDSIHCLQEHTNSTHYPCNGVNSRRHCLLCCHSQGILLLESAQHGNIRWMQCRNFHSKQIYKSGIELAKLKSSLQESLFLFADFGTPFPKNCVSFSSLTPSSFRIQWKSINR